MTVSKGQLTIGGAEDNLISGTVIVAENGTLSINGESTVTGSILVAGNFTNTATMELYGLIAVDATGESVAEASTTGAIIMGETTLGTQGTITGKLTLGDATYIKAFPGAEISEETLEIAKNCTAVFVNGEPYCAVYAKGAGVALNGIINEKIEVTGPTSTTMR